MADATDTPYVFDGSPTKLDDGSWGVTIQGEDGVEPGDHVLVTPAYGTPWQVEITEVVFHRPGRGRTGLRGLEYRVRTAARPGSIAAHTHIDQFGSVTDIPND